MTVDQLSEKIMKILEPVHYFQTPLWLRILRGIPFVGTATAIIEGIMAAVEHVKKKTEENRKRDEELSALRGTDRKN